MGTCLDAHLKRTSLCKGIVCELVGIVAMEVTPDKFVWLFLVVATVGWLVFNFTAKLLAWVASRILGAGVRFRFAGFQRLKDVSIQFRKGAIASLAIGEVRFSFRKQLSALLRDYKFQLFLSDVEVVLQKPVGTKKKTKSKSRSARNPAGERRKWLITANLAKYLKFSIAELVLKAVEIPKVSLEIKELELDMFKEDGASSVLGTKLSIMPCTIYLGERQTRCEVSGGISGFRQRLLSVTRAPPLPVIDTTPSVMFLMEQLSISSSFDHDRDAGVMIQQLDVRCRDAMVDLNEELLLGESGLLKNLNTSNKDDASLNGEASIPEAAVPDIALSTPTLQVNGGHVDTEGANSHKGRVVKVPDKVGFILPKLSVKCTYKEGIMENEVKGIHLWGVKSRQAEQAGDLISQLDIHVDCGEILVLRENNLSVLEILKVAVAASLEFPADAGKPLQVQIDVKLGGTECNLLTSLVDCWVKFALRILKTSQRKFDHPVEADLPRISKSRLFKKQKRKILWGCTFSAPDMTLVAYSLDGMALYNVSSQTSHLYVHSGSGNGLALHAEVGECLIGVADENDCSSKECNAGGDSLGGCLVRVSRVVVEWELVEPESAENDPAEKTRTLVLEASGSKVYGSISRLRSILSNYMLVERYVKSLPLGSKSKRASSSKPNEKKPGIPRVILRLEGFLIQLLGSLHTEDSTVLDPKKVNFGNQGGEAMMTKLQDGSPRAASIYVARGNSLRSKYKAVAELVHLSLCLDRDPKGASVKVERGCFLYQELDSQDKVLAEANAFGFQSLEVLYQTAVAGMEQSNCALLSANDVTVRWEPDLHLFFHEVGLQVKRLLDWRKSFRNNPNNAQDNFSYVKSVKGESSEKVKSSGSKLEVAVDVEGLNFTAEVADGVEFGVLVQSLFSEDAQIGILLEGAKVSLNGAIVCSSERLQVSRIPVMTETANRTSSVIGRLKSEGGERDIKYWDCVIHGSGTRIIMPFRLPLRGIEDACEDMWRVLKLVMAAQKVRIGAGVPVPIVGKSKKKKSSELRAVKFVMREIAGEIEEEPIQGWFDQHHRFMEEEICELIVREQLFNDKVSQECSKSGSRRSTSEGEDGEKNNSGLHQLVETGLSDPELVKKEWERLHIQSFEAYRKACEKLVPDEGSGAANAGLQGGFKPSVTRRSLASITASSLEVVLTKVEGGREGMIEIVRNLDCVEPDAQVPFSRVMGRRLVVHGSGIFVRIRDYTCPLVAAESGRCEGVVILAQQATVFPPQIPQDVFLGRWRRVVVHRSISGSSPSLKFYSQLPIELESAEVSYGVGHEPAIADISYAFSIALRKTDISVRRDQWYEKMPVPLPLVKKERSLPWWDDMRYYVHGNNSVMVTHFQLTCPATTDPYEENNYMRLASNIMEIKQSEGCVVFNGKDVCLYITSLEPFAKGTDTSIDNCQQPAFLTTPIFQLEITMDWDCESRNPLNHYLHAFPNEGRLRNKLYDPFRSTSFSLGLNFSLKANAGVTTENANESSGDAKGRIPPLKKGPIRRPSRGSASPSFYEKVDEPPGLLPTMNLGAHDLIWIFKWWSLFYVPPHKLRSFARFPRFHVARVRRSGNLSLDKVLTEFMLRVDSTPACIKHSSLLDDDPAEGLIFLMQKLKYEMCYSRGLGQFTMETKRDPLELVYQGIDIYKLKAELHRSQPTVPAEDNNVVEELQKSDKVKQLLGLPEGTSSEASPGPARGSGRGFLLSTDCLTIRKQAPKADSARLSFWQEAARRHLRVEAVRHTSVEPGSESDLRSDPSDDDGFSIVLADNCLRVSLYGFKLLWTIENRDAVWAWFEDIAQAFEHPKPSPSRQYAQRKRMEEQQRAEKEEQEESIGCDEVLPAQLLKGGSSVPSSPARLSRSHPSPAHGKVESLLSNPSALEKLSEDAEEEGEGTMHFMVNVVQPQFNLDSEDAHGRLLLAAASGRVLARSFHSIVYLGFEALGQTLGSGRISTQSGGSPVIAWKRRELSVLLEHVQAHIAPTDVDPGAGLQWLPRIPTGAPKIKRTGTLLERVFMPCTMYFQYTRQKGGTTDCKVKPLKELSFNSPNITATMTSRQFQIMVDVISNLLLARLPKPRKNKHYEEGEEEEADEVVPDGVEEVQLARIKLEQAQRECRLLFRDLRTLRQYDDLGQDMGSFDSSPPDDDALWMISSTRSILASRLEAEFAVKNKARKAARVALRVALQLAAQRQLMVKEKNKGPSAAMRISWVFDKLVWSMLCDGEPFAEAEINNMILMVDRDFHDIGVAKFTIKSFVVKNGLHNAKSNTVLAAWNPPGEWGRNSMLRVDARQGAPNDGKSPLEFFEVSIYPLRIYLTETMYRKLWEYLFPGDEQDVKRQDVWKVSTAVAAKRGGRRGSTPVERSNLDSSVIATRTSLSGAGFALAPHALHGLPTDVQPPVDFLMAAQALEKTQQIRKASGTTNISEPGQMPTQDRTEETEVEMVSEEVAVKTTRQGSSVRTSITITSRQDVLTTGAATSNGPTTSGEAGSVKTKERRISKTTKASILEEKKDPKMKKSFLEFHNIKISQVELLVTYEGSRFAVSELRLLMDTFLLVELTGSWRRLFSKVKKHIIWSVLKSVTGMQGKKFKDKLPAQPGPTGSYSDSDSSDSTGSRGVKGEQFPIKHRRQSDRAGEGFVSSIRGLFNLQRKKAKALVLRTMRGAEGFEVEHSSSSEEEATSSKSPRGKAGINKAKRVLRLQARKHRINRLKGHLGDHVRVTPEASPSPSEAECSDAPSAYEDFD